MITPEVLARLRQCLDRDQHSTQYVEREHLEALIKLAEDGEKRKWKHMAQVINDDLQAANARTKEAEAERDAAWKRIAELEGALDEAQHDIGACDQDEAWHNRERILRAAVLKGGAK